MTSPVSTTTAETARAPGSEPTAPSPSQDANARTMPIGKRFTAKTQEEREAESKAKIAELEAKLAAQAAELAELREGLHRLAEVMGRADALLPAATAEQIKAAYDRGGELRVLATYSRGEINLQAGRTIKARHYPIDKLMDLARVGMLRVAVLAAPSKAA